MSAFSSFSWLFFDLLRIGDLQCCVSFFYTPMWVSYTFIYMCVYVCMCAKLLQLCLILCDPVDSCLPVSFVHGILQVRILEWVAMPSSRGSSWCRDRNCVSYISCIGRRTLYHQCHLGSAYTHAHTHTYTHIVFIFFSVMVYHRILNIVFCAIQ